MIAAKSSILCTLLMGVVTADVNVVFNKTEKINGQPQSINIHNSLLTAVICGEPVGPKSYRHCLITHTSTNNQNESLSCPYELDDYYEAINAYPLTENKAILIVQTSEKAEDRANFVEVISFPDCELNASRINFEDYTAVVANFRENGNAIMINDDGTFDVLYNNAKFCNDKVCKLTINDQGYVVKEPNASFVPVVGGYRTLKKLPGSSSFIVTELKIDEAYRISLIKPEEQVVLKEFKTYDDWRDHDVSTSHGLIRLCSKTTNTTKVDCELFDHLSGNSTAKISVIAPQIVDTVAVENLPNGEFLLLGENEETGNLMKIKGDGSIIGVTELSRFTCAFGHESYLDVIDDKYCITRQCITKENMKTLKECYGNSDFH